MTDIIELNQLEPQQCGVFDGQSGKLLIISLTSLGFVCYMSIFYTRRKLGKEIRTPMVFFMDLSKMCIGQMFAWAINLLNTHRNASSDFDALSWYFPTFLGDELISVPLGVLIGKLVTKGFQRLGSVNGTFYKCTEPLHVFGRYKPEANDYYFDMSVNSNYNNDIRVSWLFMQMFVWVLCVVASRWLGGLIVPLCEYYLDDNSPFYLLAEGIYNLDMTCVQKQWLFAGFLRVVIDILQLAFVDFFNKYVKRRPLIEGQVSSA